MVGVAAGGGAPAADAWLLYVVVVAAGVGAPVADAWLLVMR